MVDLVAKSAASGLLPVSHGAASLREVAFERITCIAPFRGRQKTVAAALRKSVGIGLPDTGRALLGTNGEVIWTGHNQYFVLNAIPGKMEAALTDQSDAWTWVNLEGPTARDILARLCPLDLRHMEEGDTARSLIGHMPAILITRAGGYDIMVFRAFARTLVHEVETAMKSVAAQADLA